ncbi:MAG: PH domain-containing protein [Lachnospiraceae bacterium]|nr:PH domain-containing protein [Candidatus Colinaster equi]
MTFRERKRWLFFGLPFTFTVYSIKDDMITIDTGFFKKEENDCYMYKVVDVKLTRTFIERIFGLGTITCITGDSTDPILLIKHIKKAKEIKDYILEASEQARLKRRTVNMLDIGAGDMSDVEPDSFTN